MHMETLALGLCAFVLSYVGVGSLRCWAEQRQVIDVPNERSSHTRPTPRGGGLASLLVTLSGVFAYAVLHPDHAWPALSLYFTGAVLIAIVSWLDDLRSLSARVRLVVHSAGAGLAILGFGYWRTVSAPLLGTFDLHELGLLLTFLWIVGLTNAYNFIDGIDGLSGGAAVLLGLSWAAIGWFGGQSLALTLGLLLAMSSLGFLGHNWPPARIFMGDVGSAFLGYTFAILAVMASRSNPSLSIVGALLMWPYIFDTAFTFLRRLFNHENVFAAHRSHLYQRLVVSGYSHQRVTLLYLGLTLAGMALSWLWLAHMAWSDAIIALALPLLCLALWGFVRYREQRGSASRRYTPFVVTSINTKSTVTGDQHHDLFQPP